MKWLYTLACVVPLLVIGPIAQSQEYWEYDRWDQEWERHDPVAGLKYEYGDDGVDVEEEAYEWEPGEGYHEEEWYDPSDWFDADSSVDYEDDYNWGYGDGTNLTGYDYDHYYDYIDDYYEENYRPNRSANTVYDRYDYDYDYLSRFDDNRNPDDADYEFNQELSGEIIGLQRIRGTYGQPQSVVLKLKTDDGTVQDIRLGDRAYADRFLPKFNKGDRVAIGGERTDVNGRNIFRAKELRSGVASYRIPAYEYEQKVEGKIVGLRQVKLNEGQVSAVVARVKPDNGATMDVLLGSKRDVNRQATTIRPGAEIQVDGYTREVDGERTFVVQNVSIESASDRSNQSIN